MADSPIFNPSSNYLGGSNYLGEWSGRDIPQPSFAPLSLPDERGEFRKGLARGTDSLQAMGLGALGLGADLVGADGAKEYFYEQALKQQAEASMSPAAVESFTSIQGAGDLGKWFMGAAGEALPSSAASFLLSGAGALAFRTIAGKLATDLTAKAAVSSMAESLVAKGIAENVAKEVAVKEFMKAELAKQAARGAYAGAMTSGTVLESGSNWMDDAQKYGLEGTNPYKDLLFGVAGGAVEAGLGAERRLIGKLAASKAEKELADAAKRGLLKSIGKEVVASSGGEGKEEFIQQMLSQASTMRDADLADMLYAKQDWKQNFNAGMAGAAGGVLFGATGGTTDFLKSRGYKGPAQEQSASQALSSEKSAALDIVKKNAVVETQQYDMAIQKVADEKARLLNNSYQIHLGNIEPQRREALIAQVQQQFMDLSAQEVKLKAAKEEYVKTAKADYDKLEKKYDKNILEEVAKEQVTLPRTPQEYQQKLLEKEREAVGAAAIDQHAQREMEKASSRVEQHQAAIDTIHKQIATARETGGVIGNEVNSLLKFHEQQLADERKYLAAVSKEYTKATAGDLLAAQSLFTYYRDKNHANNLIASVYQDTAKGVSDAVADTELAKYRNASKSPLEQIEGALRGQRSRAAAAHDMDSMSKAISNASRLADIQATLKAKNVSEAQRWFNNNALVQAATRQAGNDINIAVDMEYGKLPVPLPYSERSTSLPGEAARAPMTEQEMALAESTRPLASSGMQAEMNRMALLRQQPQNTTIDITPNQPNAYLQRVSERKREVRNAEAQGAVAAWTKAEELFAKHQQEMKQDERAANNAFLKLSVNTNAARNAEVVKRVTTWIAGTVSKLKALQDVVKVLHTDELYTLPDYVRDEYEGGSGLIDLKTGTIYLFADKFHNKQHAVRTLLHEAVAHFGLRTIMTPEQMDKFLHMVARDFIGTDKWQDIKKMYPEYDTFSIAEEYVAKYAEQIRLNPETMTKARLLFEKVKAFLKNLLQQLGLVKVTEQDIKDILLASVHNLSSSSNLIESVLEHKEANNKSVLLVQSPKVWFDVKSGIGAVPDNQNVDYLGFRTRLTPDQFLSLASQYTPYEKSIEYISKAINKGKGLGVPFLEVAWDKKLKAWQVTGHEGRHRNTVMQKMGISSPIEVHVFLRGGLRARDLTEEMRNAPLIPQDQRNAGPKTKLKNAIAQANEWRTVRESRDYKNWMSNSAEWVKDTFKKTKSTVEGNVVKLSQDLTFREKTLIALHDTFHPILNLIELVKQAGGKIDISSNVYEAEKTMHNEIANPVLDFLINTMGVDPQNRAARPHEGTLFDLMTKLADGKIIPKDPQKILEIVGLVLQAYHAEEANRVLALKSIDTQQLARAEKKIADIKAELAGKEKLSPKKITELEESLTKAMNLRERVLDVREDLFGMSNERAQKILAKYVDNNPNKAIWMKLVTQVQEINKMIMDKAVAEGLLDPRLRKIFDETYAYYVPNKRWEEEMIKISPSYGNMNRLTNLGLWEYTKERTGTDELGANPVVALARKMEDVIRVSAEKRMLTTFANMAEANPEQLSQIIEKDNRAEITAYSNELKKLQEKIDDILSDEDLGSIRDTIRALRKKIKALKFDQVKQRNKLLKNATDVSRAKADAELTRIALDIQNAEDNIAALQQKRDDLKKNPEYLNLRQQQKDLKAERNKLYEQRGYKPYINENGVIKWKRNPSKFTGQMDKVITVYNSKGEKVRYLIKDPNILAALRGTHLFKAEALIKFLGGMQRIMAQLYTTFSPAFIPVNAFRDWLTANIHIRHLAEDIKDMNLDRDTLTKLYNQSLPESLKFMWEYHREGGVSDPKWEQKIKDFRQYGGYTSMYNLGNFGKTSKILTHTLSRGLDSKKSTKEALYATMNWMQDASGSIENASRLAAFSVIQDALMANGYTREDASKVAAGAALDLTVNFTKRGTWGPIISSLFLFAQASINSSVRITRAMFPASDKGKPVMQRRITKYAAGLAVLGFMTALLGRAIGGDDKDGVAYYDKIPTHKKYVNWMIPVGPNVFVTLPIAFGYQMFYTLGAIAADVAFGRSTPGEGTAALFDSAMNNFSIVGGGDEGILALTPTLFKPLVQVAANKNFFGGKVYPEAKSWEKGEKPDSQKSWKNTGALFKFLAENANAAFGGTKDRPAPFSPVDISPASMEHVMRQYTGGAGDALMRTMSILQKVVAGQAADLSLSDIPLVTRFATRSTKENTLHEYSKIKREIETQLNEVKRAKEERVPAGELAKVLNATSKGRLLDKRLDDVQKQLAAIHAAENRMMSNPSISNEEKFNTRLRNEERADEIVQRFIKSAHMMGIK